MLHKLKAAFWNLCNYWRTSTLTMHLYRSIYHTYMWFITEQACSTEKGALNEAHTIIGTQTPPTWKYNFRGKVFNIWHETWNMSLSRHILFIKHIFLILEQRLMVFVWLSPLWIHIKIQSFVVMWVCFEKKSWYICHEETFQKIYIPKLIQLFIRCSDSFTRKHRLAAKVCVLT